MKRLCLIILLALGMQCSYAQLKVDTTVALHADYGKSVKQFLNANQFAYALIYWNTSNWFHNVDELNGLVQQNGNWYVLKLKVPGSIIAESKKYLQINSLPLQKKEAQIILKNLNAQLTFKYRQQDFDSLETAGCTYAIYDAGTVHLAQYKKSAFNCLHYDSPEYYVDKCAPQFYQFNILQPFIHTAQQMNILLKKHINN